MTSQEYCTQETIHPEVISRAEARMPKEEVLYDLAEIYKIFGDTTRIRILWALSTEEMCGCDLAALLNITPSAVSHQLRLLRSARLVKSSRDGKMVYYSLCDDHVRGIFELGLEHILHN